MLPTLHALGSGKRSLFVYLLMIRHSSPISLFRTRVLTGCALMICILLIFLVLFIFCLDKKTFYILKLLDSKRYVAPGAPVQGDEDKRKVVFVIARVGGSGGGSGSVRTHQSPFTVRNVSHYNIRVYPKSNLAITFNLNTYP